MIPRLIQQTSLHPTILFAGTISKGQALSMLDELTAFQAWSEVWIKQGTGTHVGVRDYLKNHGVTYFYFKDRDDAYVFMRGFYNGAVPNLASTTARCGNTGTSPSGTAIVSMIYDRCFNPKIATIGGTATAGNILTLTFKDAALSPSPQSVSYTVQAGNNLTAIATGLKNAVNNNANLKSHGFTATSSGAAITIVSATSNTAHDTYSFSLSGGATATITLSNGLNVGLTKTAAHESGHAFDFAWAKDHGGQTASQSAGFKALAVGSTATSPQYAGDIVYVKPANWTALTQAQKVAYVCNMFKNQLRPSQLEQSLGVWDEFVCLNSTTISNNTATGGHDFTSMDPSQIEALRAPYFIGTGVGGSSPLYQELFAELFAKQVTNVGSVDTLQMTDFALSDWGGFPCKVISGTYTCNPAASTTIGSNYPPASAFHCTTWVLRQFWFTQLPPPENIGTPSNPTPNSLRDRGCPDIPPTQFAIP